jgi:hypothetical protein
LAGSFFHLWLAERVFPLVFGDCAGEVEMPAAFAAGSVGPDIGFFPGGPAALSHRAHLERPGDFLRALTQGASSANERAFAAGWGLHVYTDMAVHPWVEDCVAALLSEGTRPASPDLWHLRLEWGIDCRLLAGEGMDGLWNARLHFPRRADGHSLLGAVGEAFYGRDADESLLERGEEATARWLQRIPKILWWGGHIRVAGHRPNPLCTLAFAHLGRKVLGDWLQHWARFKDGAALARPLLPSDQVYEKVVRLGESAVERFYQGFDEGFAQLGNPDLYTGEAGDG